MRPLSSMGKTKPGDLSPVGKVGGDKGKKEETETYLKPATLPSPGFLVSNAVLNASSQTHPVKDLGWKLLEGVGCRAAFPWNWDWGARAGMVIQ